jgi:hypothetical protein
LNTYNAALRIIKSKGYKVFLYPDEREEYLGNYWAIKGECDFIAEDPLRLLGLISIWEAYGNEWNNQKQKAGYENVREEILDRAFPDSFADIENLSEEAFQQLVADYQLFWQRIFPKNILPENVTREAFFEALTNFYKWDLDSFYEWEAAKP